jgi:hypothetical protein
MLIIITAVAEMFFNTFAKGVKGAYLGHDEAVHSASRRAARPDACQRFHSPWQQLIANVAPMAALPAMVSAPTEDLALLCHYQAVGMPGKN